MNYEPLNFNSINSMNWDNLELKLPSYYFIPKDFILQKKYNLEFNINLLFPISSSGIKTHADDPLVSFNNFNQLNQKYYYKPFNIRYIKYDVQKIQRHRYSVMKNILDENNAIMTCRQQSSFDLHHVLLSNSFVDICAVSIQTKETTYVFPFYIYPNTTGQQTSRSNRKKNHKFEYGYC